LNDLRTLPDETLIEADLCIVGSGPAGLSIAKEFANTSIQVLVLESGGLTEEMDTQSLYEIESVGVPRVMQQDIIRSRIFGGTSHVWTGRCAPFDPIDFESRSGVPYSGWPLDRQTLDPYLERAGVNLGLGPHCYDDRLWQHFQVQRPTPLLDTNLIQPTFWQFSKSRHDAGESMRFGRHFMPDAPNIQVLLHANVTHINTNQAGTQVESLEVRTLEHKRACVKARAIVLCCGGIENARLLLASNRVWPNGVGNHQDTVGRFLMDHPGCVLGRFDPQQAAPVQDRFGHYWLDHAAGRHVYLQGWALSPEIQTREGLLNCAAFIEQYPAEDDPWNAMRRLRLATQQRRLSTAHLADGWAIASQPHRLAAGLYRRMKHRPPLIKAKAIDLYCLVEQSPDPESRVTLSDRKDALGMPLSKLDWRISEQERQTVRRLGQLICQELQRLGLPQPVLADWLDAQENWRSQFVDRAHPTGTTRMSVNPKEGVVDSNCQVHGVAGLFIAGSSVFPTTGHANPTLMLVALSIRLADWLKIHQFSAPASAPAVVGDRATIPVL
jgi:choline dehydrogenase-like flavoprotein